MSRPALVFPESLGVVSYQELRPSLDVFAVTWIGDNLLSRAILHFKPGGSHSSLGLRLLGNVFLCEALARGITLTRASDRFDDYAGDILIHPLDLSEERVERIKRTALNLVGTGAGYGFRTLLALAWRGVRLSMRRSVCSQFVGFCLSEVRAIPYQQTVRSPGELRAVLPRPWLLAPYSKEVDV